MICESLFHRLNGSVCFITRFVFQAVLPRRENFPLESSFLSPWPRKPAAFPTSWNPVPGCGSDAAVSQELFLRSPGARRVSGVTVFDVCLCVFDGGHTGVMSVIQP